MQEHAAVLDSMPLGESCWRLRMSVGSSFREAFERRAEMPEDAQKSFASRTFRFLLVPGAISAPVTLALALRSDGLSLRKAHETLNRLAVGRSCRDGIERARCHGTHRGFGAARGPRAVDPIAGCRPQTNGRFVTVVESVLLSPLE